jgi:glycyl-tRNA synthetase
LAILNEAYHVEQLEDDKTRVVLKLAPHLSPVKVAIIPLKKNNKEIVQLAKDVKNDLQKLGLGRIIFENTGNIGKSYRKHDEIGTPICITIDFESLEDKSVTIRDRDSMEQSRMSIQEISSFVIKKLKS